MQEEAVVSVLRAGLHGRLLQLVDAEGQGALELGFVLDGADGVVDRVVVQLLVVFC